MTPRTALRVQPGNLAQSDSPVHSPIEGVEGGLRAPTAETTVAPHIDNQRLLPHIFYGHPHNPSTGVNVGDGLRKTWDLD